MEETIRVRETRIGFFLLTALLVISGVTASVVGFNIKSADLERKSTLQATYTRIGGNPERPLLAEKPRSDEAFDDRTVARLAYEINQHVRGFGLQKLLLNVPKERWPSVEEALNKIEATEAASIVHDSVEAFQTSTQVAPGDVTLPTAVTKLTRLYTSKISRYVEAKLYKFVVDKNLAAMPR